MAFWRSKQDRSGPVDTGAHRSAQVDAASTQGDIVPDQSAPASTEEGSDPPLIFGSLRSAKEHAAQLLEILRVGGFDGRSVPTDELADIHWKMCQKLNWVPRQWPAIGRELKKLGLKKGKVWLGHHRITVYEIGPATGPVVDLAAE